MLDIWHACVSHEVAYLGVKCQGHPSRSEVKYKGQILSFIHIEHFSVMILNVTKSDSLLGGHSIT